MVINVSLKGIKLRKITKFLANTCLVFPHFLQVPNGVIFYSIESCIIVQNLKRVSKYPNYTMTFFTEYFQFRGNKLIKCIMGEV